MIGILLGLILLMVLAFRGWSIIWIAPITAGVVAVFGGLDLLPAYTDTYMGGFVSFAKAWFPVFMLGAIFGKLMEDTGFAQSVAYYITKFIGTKRAILGVIVGTAVLTYGGVSVFVVVFAIYPIAVALFREANITRRLIPGTIALGSFTFTMTALPGTPQIQNLIPMQYYETSPMAAPIIGIEAAIVMFLGGYLFLIWREKKLRAAGYMYSEPEDQELKVVDAKQLPNPLLAILPLFVVVITLNVFKWDVIIALITGILLIILLNLSMYKAFTKSINAGANGSVIAIINTSAAVGFGAVVRAVPGFQSLTDLVLGIKGNPLISEAVAVNILAGATGSASGGMGIALEALGEKYIELSMNSGISLEAFHRIASIASGGLDSLPHNGAVLTLLVITGLTHKESYLEIFVVASLIPIAATIVGIISATFGII